jgi:predicted dienelactone hydrolase
MFDLLLIGALIAATFSFMAKRLVGPRTYRWVIAVTAFICVLQFAIEGPRLQLVFAYACLALFAFGLLIQLLIRTAGDQLRSANTISHTQSRVSIISRIAHWLAASVAVIAILATMLLCVVFPRFEFPKPTGQYTLGVHEFRLTDDSRLELKTAAPDDHRQLLVRVTYPAIAANAPIATIPNNGLAGAMSILAMPDAVASIANAWGRIPTHAVIDAPIAASQQSFPVLVFSHAMMGFPEQNTVLVEELASHGYIVMAINHPYFSSYFEYPDGTTARRLMIEPSESIGYTPELIAKLRALNLQFSEAKTTAAMLPIIAKMDALDPSGAKTAAAHTKLMSDDQRFVIDNLPALQANVPLLAGHLDLQRTGVFGMSLGGSASVITCSLDTRCRAGLNMDGWTRSPEPLPPLTVPFMHMNSEHYYNGLIPYEQSKTGYHVRVNGAAHENYSDTTLAMPQAKRIGMLGPIDGSRMLQLTNEYVLAFFNKHLLGKSEPLLDGPSTRYPEVTFQSK